MTSGGAPAGPGHRWSYRHLYRYLASLAVAVLVFAFALPHLADYGDAWDAVAAMTKWELGAVFAAGLWNLVTYWPVLMISLPGLRLGEAVVVNQASTAVANTVPAGSAVALGITYRILRSWGFTSESIANHVLATGVWNNLVKLALPVVGVAALASTGALHKSTLRLAVFGLVVLALFGVIALRAVTDERAARRLGHWADSIVTAVQRRRGRAEHANASRWLLQTRRELMALVRRRGAAMTIVTAASHLSLYLVLLTALRCVGVSEDQLSWEKVLAGFALVRLLSALPITPGGVGVVELGYVAYLSAGASEAVAEITAGVLLFRAVTFLFPIALGAVAWAVYTARTSWRRPPNSRGELRVREPAGSVA